MTPEEAVQALEDMDAVQAVAVHWGTFKLTIEPLAEPPKRLQAELERRGLAADRFSGSYPWAETAALALNNFQKRLIQFACVARFARAAIRKPDHSSSRSI